MLGNTPIIAFIPTLDFDKARAFYVDVLGLRFVDNDGFAMVLDANGTMIRVAKVQPDFKPAVFTILGWEVSDIENVVSAMTAKGVVFERYGFFEQDTLGIWAAPGGAKVAWFKDPDGNTLSVSQHE
jgi:catechol 2,3-dioxygenase-like lactoylglutathione lyase family enzyme